MGNGPALKLNFPLLKVIVSPLQTDVPSLCPAAMSSIKAQRLTVTSKGTSYDFSDYINNAGSYVFTVRAVSTYGSQNSSWSAGSEPYILSVEDAWYSDNGNWKKTGNKWRFVYKDESYPACSWREIKEKWYYFDGNGYMVTNCYVKALGENLYYWISEDGVWDENETTATPNRARYLVY